MWGKRDERVSRRSAKQRAVALVYIVWILAFVTRFVITNLFLFHAPQFSACESLCMDDVELCVDKVKKKCRKQARKLEFARAFGIKIKQNDGSCNKHKIYVAEIIFNWQPEQKRIRQKKKMKGVKCRRQWDEKSECVLSWQLDENSKCKNYSLLLHFPVNSSIIIECLLVLLIIHLSFWTALSLSPYFHLCSLLCMFWLYFVVNIMSRLCNAKHFLLIVASFSVSIDKQVTEKVILARKNRAKEISQWILQWIRIKSQQSLNSWQL